MEGGIHFLRDTRYPIAPGQTSAASARLLGTSVRAPIDRLVDVSAGGLRFLCKARFEENTFVDVLLVIGGYKLKFIGQVVRVGEAEGGSRPSLASAGLSAIPGGAGLLDHFLSFQTISEKNLRKLFSLVKP